jgi:agarase
MKMPFVVGAHWFEYADEPAEGRFDGENSNYGLVNIRDEPYEVFIAAVRETNRKAYSIHAGQHQ